ncbi:MAG: GAF domain-containing SpoIIE family protein phosphatase, partial [Prochlorothrix sp.]|nr:GAF domain-containing SpoIIE family protein phosphatase [Prochlorothrix sp.]
IVSAIRESLDYEGMLQTIVATIGNNLGAEVGLLYAHEDTGLITPPFLFQKDDAPLPFPLPTLDTATPSKKATPPKTATQKAATPDPHPLTPILAELLAHFCQHPQQRSCEVRETPEGHAISLPFTYQQELLAVLVLYRPSIFAAWSEDDMQLLENVAEQSAIAVSQAKLYQWTQKQSEKLQAELAVARQIQANLLHQDLPQLEGIRVQACCQPARAVGGDFFEVYAHPQGDVWLAVGDVSGKGVPAALYMASTLSLLRRELTQEVSPEPEMVIRNLNRNLLQDLVNNNCFITAVILRYRPKDGSLAYANAGHIYPMIWNPKHVANQTQPEPQYLKTRGIPLGILEEWKGQAGVGTLTQGEVLLLASDGITEANVSLESGVTRGATPADRPPGTEALMLQQAGLWQILAQYPHGPVLEDLLALIQSQSQTQDDDQTLVSLEIV